MNSMLQKEDIKRIIPHRDPFLLLDRVYDLKPGISGRGSLYVDRESIWLEGHFPDYPVFPGVLLTESVAQLGSVVVLCQEDLRGNIPLFAGLDSVKFRRQVVPGDTVDMEVEIIKSKRKFGVGWGRALVGDKLVLEGKLKFALVPGGDQNQT